MKSKRIILLSILLLYILSPIYSHNNIESKSLNTFNEKADEPTKRKPLMSKASSDSLYKVIFGQLPSNKVLETKSKKESNKNRSFSIKTTDKVKTKSAFY